MDQSPEKAPTPKRSTNEIDRIRELVVGPQLRQNEQKIGALQKDIERLQRELRQLRSQQSEQNQTLTERLQQQHEELQDSVGEVRNELRQVTAGLDQDKVDRQKLGDLFIELGSHIKDGGAIADVLQSLFEAE
ncbi:MAG: hypothetical protein KDE54_22995 [Caldilineaceae bacterium]|nr:hypothetical protein [Caldilineaceae bacterium]MCB0094549.1 hypothetical protein [Caldilineaceae bacterium]MCB0139828.1 hypothetical protein [Caldilineaceae bacterium]